MFLRPFRTKSNSAIRSSDRKRLRHSIEQRFNEYHFEEPLTSIIPTREEINVLKIYSHKGDNVTVYCVDKNPLFFEVEKILYPTLYFTWQHSMLLPCLITQQVVISKLANGADLMLPGILTPSEGLPHFERGATVTIRAPENKSALAIGVALMSSQQIIESEEKKGKAVQVLHIFGDNLWSVGEKLQPPQINPLTAETATVLENTSDQEFSDADYNDDNKDLKRPDTSGRDVAREMGALDMKEIAGNDHTSAPVPDKSQPLSQDAVKVLGGADASHDEKEEEDKNQNVQEKMDELLMSCFLTALKTKLKESELPLLTSTFYRLHLLPCCPNDQYLEIKKTSFKKLSKFLKSMEQDRLIVIKELTKGNDSIVTFNKSHERLKTFKPLVSKKVAVEESSMLNTESQYGVVTQKQYEPPQISILYGVNAATLPFFSTVGYTKGSTLPSNEIRNLVTTYVKDNELIHGRRVTLDPILHDSVCEKHENITAVAWEELFKRLISKMQVNHQLQFPGLKPIIKKGDPPTVDISIAQRSGNKKVTLVKNLENFLIDPQDFADTIRKLAQASTSVSTLPNSKPAQVLRQVLVQGNQVNGVESILTGGLYRLPRKYLKGLQNAPKSKVKQKR